MKAARHSGTKCAQAFLFDLTDGVLSSFEENETPIINLSMMSEALFLD